MNRSNPILILTTAASLKECENIASKLVKNKLAACVNIIPNMTSIYQWNNKITKEEELQIVIKTSTKYEQAVYDHIKENHSYIIPEIITLNIKNIDKKYLEWLNSSIKQN